MRPPDLPGGNPTSSARPRDAENRFNEAAGFTRRKQRKRIGIGAERDGASMRPPDLPGGNAFASSASACSSTSLQ